MFPTVSLPYPADRAEQYGLIATVAIGPTDVRLGLTYKSDLLTEEQAFKVANRFRVSLMEIVGSLDN